MNLINFYNQKKFLDSIQNEVNRLKQANWNLKVENSFMRDDLKRNLNRTREHIEAVKDCFIKKDQK